MSCDALDQHRNPFTLHSCGQDMLFICGLDFTLIKSIHLFSLTGWGCDGIWQRRKWSSIYHVQIFTSWRNLTITTKYSSTNILLLMVRQLQTIGMHAATFGQTEILYVELLEWGYNYVWSASIITLLELPLSSQNHSMQVGFG